MSGKGWLKSITPTVPLRTLVVITIEERSTATLPGPLPAICTAAGVKLAGLTGVAKVTSSRVTPEDRGSLNVPSSGIVSPTSPSPATVAADCQETTCGVRPTLTPAVPLTEPLVAVIVTRAGPEGAL